MDSYLLIKNGTVVNDDAMFEADVLVFNDKIQAVGMNITVPKVADAAKFRVIDAKKKYIIPGGIDPHTHMQLPFMGTVAVDDFEAGTKAALAGGTTMIIDFVIPDKAKNESLVEAYEKWKGWAEKKVCCDYAFSMAIVTWDERTSKEMEMMVTPQYGINSFKFFLAYKGTFMVTDEQFFNGLKKCSDIGALARVHAENGSVIDEKQKELIDIGITGPEGHTQSRPEELEAEATNRACTLAGQANCPLYVVHVMSKGAADVIAYHRSKGNTIFGEPIAAGLACDGHHYYDEDWQQAANYVLSPPLSRDPNTPGLLMDLLASGQLHLTATDNCTFNCSQKRRGLDDFRKIPNGVNGVEDRMSVVWEKGVNTGKIDPMKFVSITSSTAAKIFNIYPKKGRIAENSDADIVIWDPQATKTISAKTHKQAVDYNIFEGMKVRGLAQYTISRGKVVYENSKLDVKPGTGKYIKLEPNCNYVFNAIRVREEVNKPICVHRCHPSKCVCN